MFSPTRPGVPAKKWIDELQIAASIVKDATDVTYTPTTLADWTAGADPGNVDGALDELAGRVTDNETNVASLQGSPVFAPLTTPLTSTSWDGDARSDTNATKIDLSAVFGAPAGIAAVLIHANIRDSAVWGSGDYYIHLGPSADMGSGLRCYGGDLRAEADLVVPCDANGDIYYEIDASGAGTMDVELIINGYWL